MENKHTEDLRVRRTKKLLWEALVDLTEERGYKNFTVKELCERAMVNRATFYRYYEDKRDLLVRRTAEILGEMAKEAPDPRTVAAQPTGDPIVPFIKLVRRHPSFFRTMVNAEEGAILFYQIMDFTVDQIIERMSRWNQPEEKMLVPPEPHAHFRAGAAVGLLRWWLTNDMPCSEEELARYLMLMSMVSVTAVAGLHKPGEEPLESLLRD
jgi:AcrR family transcriptional regulator